MDIDRSARISGRPDIPSFQGGRVLIRLRLGKLLVDILQVLKPTDTSLTLFFFFFFFFFILRRMGKNKALAH